MERKRRFRIPIYVKTIFLIVFLASLVVITAMSYFSIVLDKNNYNSFTSTATRLSETTSEVINKDDVKYLKDKIAPIFEASDPKPTSEEWGSDDWNAYIAQFEFLYEDPIFIRTKKILTKMGTANEVECVYLCYVDPTYELFIYLCDGAEEDACPPGCIDELYDVNKRVLDDPTIGFPPYVTNTEEYGYLVTSGTPIYYGEGDAKEVIGYATVDVSMNLIRDEQAKLITNMFIFLLGITAVISVIGIVAVHFLFNKPIKKLTTAIKSYDKENQEKTHRVFNNLNINTRDEVEDFAIALKKMENDINDRMYELVRMNKELSNAQKETKKMSELANRDGLTGVQNKIAYNSEVEKINKAISINVQEPFGIAMIDLNYLKLTNDEQGHDAGDESLIKLANIICETFKHSPVYRIGGDEFVVILRKSDYMRASILLNNFNNQIDEVVNNMNLKKSERISAAIGYSTYSKDNDKSVDDVFKRADKLMYERKHQMKEKKE